MNKKILCAKMYMKKLCIIICTKITLLVSCILLNSPENYGKLFISSEMYVCMYVNALTLLDIIYCNKFEFYFL